MERARAEKKFDLKEREEGWGRDRGRGVGEGGRMRRVGKCSFASFDCAGLRWARVSTTLVPIRGAGTASAFCANSLAEKFSLCGAFFFSSLPSFSPSLLLFLLLPPLFLGVEGNKFYLRLLSQVSAPRSNFTFIVYLVKCVP